MTSTHVQEVLDREAEAQKKEKKRIEEINKKRVTPMPGYPERNYDARTTKEVAETRRLEANPRLDRRARRLKRRGVQVPGPSFDVKKDSDGAFRIFNRLDGSTKAFIAN